jgi:hypothetical protein
MVLIQWAWSYMTYERGARLITGSDELSGWKESQTTHEKMMAEKR